MTKNEVDNILKQNGIRRNSKSWQDYEFAKSIFYTMFSQISDMTVRYITNYIGV